MRRLAWTFAARIGDKYQIRLTQSIYEPPHDKTNKVAVRPAKTQISLGIHPVWSESSLCAQWVAKDPNFLHADSKDSDQTGRMQNVSFKFSIGSGDAIAEL